MALADPALMARFASPISGWCFNGLTTWHLFSYILNSCATVEEAKEKILENRVIQSSFGAHFLFADKEGNATVFEIDHNTQAYVFTDGKPGEPLFITNHPVSTYTTPDKFPMYDPEAEHDTFYRMKLLKKTYSEKKSPLTRDDAIDLMEVVHCAFTDYKKAQYTFKERTLFNVNGVLSKRKLNIRFYLHGVAPIPGTNHMEDVTF